MATGDDVKKEIETFNRNSLNDVETKEKIILPDAEGMYTISINLFSKGFCADGA